MIALALHGNQRFERGRRATIDVALTQMLGVGEDEPFRRNLTIGPLLPLTLDSWQ
jgi:hypothetical protein